MALISEYFFKTTRKVKFVIVFSFLFSCRSNDYTVVEHKKFQKLIDSLGLQSEPYLLPDYYFYEYSNIARPAMAKVSEQIDEWEENGINYIYKSLNQREIVIGYIMKNDSIYVVEIRK